MPPINEKLVQPTPPKILAKNTQSEPKMSDLPALYYNLKARKHLKDFFIESEPKRLFETGLRETFFAARERFLFLNRKCAR